MKPLLLLLLLAAPSASARQRKDPSCPEGYRTYVDTRISGAGNPSLQRHQMDNRKLFSSYACERCAKGAITVVDGYGWNVCLGGRPKLPCGPHAAPVGTGDPDRPEVCVPCPAGQRQVVVNGSLRCLPHDCKAGTAPARHRGVVEEYRCVDPYEDPHLIVWENVVPSAPKAPPPVPSCAEGQGLLWDATAKEYRCEACGEGRTLLSRYGYPVCGRETVPRCGKREAFVDVHDLRGRAQCEKCPRRYTLSEESGVPRCLRPG